MRFYSDPNSHIAFQEAYQEDFKYSDFFRDQASHCLGDVRREFICCGLDSGLEKAVLIQVNYDQYKSFRAHRASNPEVRKFRTLLKSHFRYIFRFRKSYGEQRQDPGRECRYF